MLLLQHLCIFRRVVLSLLCLIGPHQAVEEALLLTRLCDSVMVPASSEQPASKRPEALIGPDSLTLLDPYYAIHYGQDCNVDVGTGSVI